MANKTQKPKKDNFNPSRNTGQDQFDKIIDKNFSPGDERMMEERARQDGDEDLEALEQDAAQDQSADDETIDQKENRGNGAWKNNTTPQQESRVGLSVNFTKKKAIAGGISGLIGVVIALFVTLGPSAALIHLKEVLLDKFDSRANSLIDKRSSRVMVSKMSKDMTKGCTIKVKCRFKGMSKKEIDKFERRNPGTKIETESCRTIGPVSKCKVKSITYIDEDGKKKTVSAREFKNTLKNSPNLRNNVRTFNKSKVAHWRDSATKKLYTKLKVFIGKTKGISKDSILDDPKSRGEETRERVRSTVSGESFDISTRSPLREDGTEDQLSKRVGEELAEELGEEAEEMAEASADGKIRVPKFGNIYTLALEGVCMVRSLVSYAATAAKLKNATVLIRYAVMFFRMADQTKTGDSKNTSATRAMGLLAGILQKPNPNNDNKTAFDSSGYQYAAYGYVPKNNSEYKKFILGGGAAGTAGSVAKNKFAKAGCSVVNFVGDLILAIPVVGDALGAAGGVLAKPFMPLLEAAVSSLTAALSGTLITGDEYGDEAGNAIVAGTGALSSMVNRAHGFFPLSKLQAIGYQEDVIKTQNLAAADSGVTYQLDPSNINSFANRFASAVAPSMNGISLQNIPQKTFGFIQTATSSMSLNAYAKSADYVEGEYDTCPDDDYDQLDIAADMFCNPQYGLDPSKVGDASSSASSQYDPEQIVAYMCGRSIDDELPCNRFIDNDGSAIVDSEYDKWIEKCTETDQPVSSDEEGWPEGLDKKACLDPAKTSDPVKYDMFRLYYFDETLEDQFGNESNEDESADGGGINSAPETVDLATLYEPSTDIQCAGGSKNLGVETGYHSGKKLRIRLCAINDIPETGETSEIPGANGKLVVNSRMSAIYVKLAKDAKADGIAVSAAEGFRTMSRQEYFWNLYQSGGGNLAARPGYSNHQSGVAVDWAPSVYNWLSSGKAQNYGIKKCTCGEAWHYSPDGG